MYINCFGLDFNNNNNNNPGVFVPKITRFPLSMYIFYLSKSEFHDALALRYNKTIKNLPSECPCGKPFIIIIIIKIQSETINIHVVVHTHTNYQFRQYTTTCTPGSLSRRVSICPFFTTRHNPHTRCNTVALMSLVDQGHLRY